MFLIFALVFKIYVHSTKKVKPSETIACLGKIAVLVLLKLFFNGYESCNTTHASKLMSGTIFSNVDNIKPMTKISCKSFCLPA